MTTSYFRSGQKKGRVSLDLNQDVKHRFFEKFDLVLDMGVIQHCASPLSVLNHCAYYVKPGGYILHSTFMDLKADQAFFQLSPTFFYDFYSQNKSFNCCTMYGWRFNFGLLKLSEITQDTYHYNTTKSRLTSIEGLIHSTKKISSIAKIIIPVHHIYGNDDKKEFFKYNQSHITNYNESILNIAKFIIRKVNAYKK